MKIVSIENLDKALNFLYARIKQYYNHDRLKAECFDNSSEIDVEAIIDKLKSDGSIHYGLNESNKTDFKISVDGCILKERGGYSSKFRREWFQRHPFIEKSLLLVIGATFAVLSNLLISKSTKPAERVLPKMQDIELVLQKQEQWLDSLQQSSKNVQLELRRIADSLKKKITR
jgi:cell division protein FtsL